MRNEMRSCKLCGSSFSAPVNGRKRHNYCSDVCFTEGYRPNLSGLRFGRLFVLGKDGSRWQCVCDCGNPVAVKGHGLRSGHTQSCGCKQRDEQSVRSKRHGYQGTPTYTSWQMLRKRCDNPADPSFHNYGGRGIGYDPAWKVFENFLADMGERPPGTSIDRIDNNAGYSKENCVWATRREQQRNRRGLHMIEYGGRSQCLTAWCEELGLSKWVVGDRIKRGVPAATALGLTPDATPAA